jgi:uncharacterized protein YjiS (DUF1127 family)
MTILTFHQPLGAAGAVRGTRETSAVGRISRCRGTVASWIARFRQRRALYEIAERDDQHLLKDIGVSREEAFREADKPFWRR